jgi:membrane protein
LVSGSCFAVSLVVSTALAALTALIGSGGGPLAALLNFSISLIVLAVLFTMLFKWFPDADVAWRDASWGGAATALLFNVGKLAISWYIGMQGFESTYGAAASLVILLIWIYYSAQIALFGAEITHALTRAAHGGEPARVFSDGCPSAHPGARK